MRRLIVALALAGGAGLHACASPGYPPGGPEDLDPPVLVSIAPDSAATSVDPDRVLFRFDEVIDERSGGQDLSELFLISPMDGEIDVDWRRQTLAVRPRRGEWRPNTVYTVTLLPGVRDLRGNVLDEGAATFFSTGPIIPDTELTGVAFDWAAGRELPLAFVEAIARPDSIVYIARADSSGRFLLRHLRTGIYTMRTFADANRNRLLDPREPWDTVQVSLTDTASVALYAFIHDTIGPAVSDVRHRDSVTLRLILDEPLDVEQVISPALFTILDPDSVPVPIAEALAAWDWDARERELADTAQADTTRPPAPVPPPAPRATPDSLADTLSRNWPIFDRPVPVTEIVARLARSLAPETQYRIISHELRNLAGWARTSDRTFTTPAAPPPPPARPDSVPPPSREARPR